MSRPVLGQFRDNKYMTTGMFKQVIKTLCLRSVWITGNRLVVVNHMNLWSTHSKCIFQNVSLKMYLSKCISQNVFLKMYFSRCIPQIYI